MAPLPSPPLVVVLDNAAIIKQESVVMLLFA